MSFCIAGTSAESIAESNPSRKYLFRQTPENNSAAPTRLGQKLKRIAGVSRLPHGAGGKKIAFTTKIFLHNCYDVMSRTLGLERAPNELTFSQIAVRGVIVFFVALVMLRLGDRRFLSKKTAFDAILGLILASMLGRAVNGTASFFATLGGGFVMVGMHRLVALIAWHSRSFGTWVKGRSDLVIKDGEVQLEAMRKNDLSERDLLEALRLNGHLENPGEVKSAYFERSGDISVVPDLSKRNH